MGVASHGWGCKHTMAVKGGDELAPFLIKNVEGLEESADKEEKQAGHGAYGYVFKVNVNGVERIAKKIHSAYVNQVNPEEKQGITSKFRAECIILSKLRHPNIVQFVGVHYGRGGMTDLTLFMECLGSDLDKFLSTRRNLPLSLKLSILRDISSGLVYLHCEPPVVHRDLTARNILISDRHQAKIADLGMAKLVDIHAQLASSHTQVPGHVYYMPPEALKEKASCTPKSDIFSFGHLALCTVIQEFPKVYNVTMTMDILQQGISERLKRRRALDVVGEGHCLYPIITECLFDNPDQRPTSRDLNSRLCLLATQNPEPEAEKDKTAEIAHQLSAEKQENGRLAARLSALDHQYRLEREAWLTDKSNMDRDKSNMDRAIRSMTQQVQELLRAQSQADILRDRVQKERKKVQQFERELQSSQELLRKMEEEHKSEIEYTKAKCDDERLELERKVTPLKRELELLRSQTFVDTRFAETYRRMEVERKELREEKEGLREEKEGLREELQTITAKYHAMVDDYTAAREVLLQSDLRLPKRNVDVQNGSQTQPAQLPQSTYPRTPDEVQVRPYLGEKAAYPPTSEGYSSQCFRHLGEDRPPVQDNMSPSYPAEMRQSEGSVRAQTSNFENCPKDNFNYNQKMISKSSRFEEHGSVEYGLKPQDHPIMNRQLQQQLQEQAYQQNQQPRGQQPMSQQPIPSQQPMIPQQPATRQPQPGPHHGQQPPVQQLGVGMQHGGQQPQPGMQLGQQPQLGMQHRQHQHHGMQRGQQPGMQQPGMQHGQQPGMQQPGMQHGQMGGALYNPPQQNLSITNAPSQPYQQGSPPRSQHPHSPKPWAPPQSHDPAVSGASGGQQQPYQQGSPPRSQHPRSPKPGAPVNIPQSHDPAVSRAAGGQQQPGVYQMQHPTMQEPKYPPAKAQSQSLKPPAPRITHEIKEMADYVRAEVSEDNEQLKTMEHSPYDPNLVCPMCKKRHRVGEIQKYRKHVANCDGGIDADEHMYR